jgi:hypothetical protein
MAPAWLQQTRQSQIKKEKSKNLLMNNKNQTCVTERRIHLK